MTLVMAMLLTATLATTKSILATVSTMMIAAMMATLAMMLITLWRMLPVVWLTRALAHVGLPARRRQLRARAPTWHCVC